MKKLTIVLIIGGFILSIFFVYLIFNYNYLDQHCLDNYSKKYCKSINKTYYDTFYDIGSFSRIRCYYESPMNDMRNTAPLKLGVYKFLPEELKDCSRRLLK